MLTREENLMLCQVGPGTAGGDLHRRYWQPVAATAELLKNPIKKIRILGEDLVLFKNLKGTYGLTADRCAHRQVSLEYAIPDELGIRCPYHGWLYDEKGQCRETPLEPANSKLASKICIKAYPVQELGGLLFAYLGPVPVPFLNRWDLFVWPNSFRQIGSAVMNCNWLQAVENSLDPRHNEYLHGHFYKYWGQREGIKDLGGRPELEIKNRYTKHEAVSGEHGLISYVEREALPPNNKHYRGIHNYCVFPYFSRQSRHGIRSHIVWRVPIDDTHTKYITYELYTTPPGYSPVNQNSVPHHESPVKDEKGNWLFGDSILPQDVMAWESQGEIADRSIEKLGASDIGIVILRRQLKEQIEIVKNGGTPKNVFYEPHEIIELEPKMGKWDPNVLKWETTVGYDKFYPGKHGGIIDEVRKLLDLIAQDDKLFELNNNGK